MTLPLLLVAVTARADDGFFGGSGDTVFPLHHHDVRMVSEKVDITETGEGHGWSVRCFFVFQNTGPETTIRMGFPDHQTGVNGREPGWGIRDFTTLADGKKTEIDVRKAIGIEDIGLIDPELLKTTYVGKRTYSTRVFTWQVHFDANQTRRLTNTYSFGPSGRGVGQGFLHYSLTTGALWKGTIGKATITIKFLPGEALKPRIREVKPGGYSLKENTLSWVLTDFEPTENIDVVYMLPGMLKRLKEAETR